MKILKQPKGSNLCGQTCVAMLTNTTIDKATKVIGKGGKTYNKDLIQGLTELDVECSPKSKRGVPECDAAIVKVRFFKKTRTWHHWVLWVSGSVICPGKGEKIPAEQYVTQNPVIMVSHIEVNL